MSTEMPDMIYHFFSSVYLYLPSCSNIVYFVDFPQGPMYSDTILLTNHNKEQKAALVLQFFSQPTSHIPMSRWNTEVYKFRRTFTNTSAMRSESMSMK